MVKTRHQATQELVEERQKQSMPPSSLPPKVCVGLSATPILKKPKSALFHSTSARQKKRLSFATHAPQEFHFETASPTVRRLLQTTEAVHDSAIIQEHLARGEECPVEIGKREKEMHKIWVGLDLKRKLKVFFLFNCDDAVEDGDVPALEQRLKFAESLRRRVEIRRATTMKQLPHELSMRDLQSALLARRMRAHNLTYQQACEALERSILKEDVCSMVGEGYEFGRRRVSANDLIAYQNLSDKEMRDLLKTGLRAGEAMPKSKTEKLERLIEIAQRLEEEEVRKLLRLELEREAARRCLFVEEGLDLDALFETVFLSGRWEEAYPDVDNTPLPEDEAMDTAACSIV